MTPADTLRHAAELLEREIADIVWWETDTTWAAYYGDLLATAKRLREMADAPDAGAGG